MTGYQIGWLAIGYRRWFFVGFGVRLRGQGDVPVFGFIGAIYAVLSCAIGNLLSIIGFLVEDETSMGFMDAVLGFDDSLSVEILTATFQPMDVLFYGLALYAGYRYSIVGE